MSPTLRGLSVALSLLLGAALPQSVHAADTPVKVPELITVPAGAFITGSSAEEREAAYQLDEEAYGHSVTRQRRWYAREGKIRTVKLPAFRITRNLITNESYAQFLKATGHRFPSVTQREWKSYGLVHPYSRAVRHMWSGTEPPEGRRNHPVVLVSYSDAEAYARWLSTETGDRWRLPRESEWMKAARGTDGRWFPWGNAFDPALLNSHDRGPFDTVPVGSFRDGASPFGLLDAAGQVFEWTATPAGKDRHVVKGGSWDDKGCGVCRPAARHGRPDHLKHILIGFRLIRE